MALTWENAEFAHGPRLADWLEPKVGPHRVHGSSEESLLRSLKRIKEGRVAVRFMQADSLMIRCGVLPFEAPEDIWIVPDRDSHGQPILPSDEGPAIFRPTPTQARVLGALQEAGRPLTARDIMEATGLRHDATYQALRALHGHGAERVGRLKTAGPPALLWVASEVRELVAA